MILELTGSRIVAPYLGTSTIIWTTLIGVILASLSVGYWVGGKEADKNPSIDRLSLILTTAMILLAVIPFIEKFIAVLAPALPDIRSAALISAFILFSPATIFLGMVSPYVARLSMQDVSHSGETVGKIYAFSTVGSIVGTFLGGFVLISFFGSTKIVFALSIIIGVLALLAKLRSKRSIIIALVIVLISAIGLWHKPNIILAQGGNVILDMDSTYERYWIYESVDEKTGRPTRILSNTIYGSQSGMYLDQSTDLLFDYTRAFNIWEAWESEPSHVLMIGAGAYTYPRHLLASTRETKIDVVEIDPLLTELSYEYFDLEDTERMSIFHTDGRRFLNEAAESQYDLIVHDAFSSAISIPHHLTTLETVEHFYRTLASDGVVLVNHISALEGFRSEFIQSSYKTYADVFPYVYIVRVRENVPPGSPQNVMLVASKIQLPLDKDGKYQLWDLDVNDEAIVITDEFAPVERFTFKLFL